MTTAPPASASGAKTVSLTRYAWLSVGASLLTIALKTGAYWLTGSVGLLSDAMESLVNLAGAIMALSMLFVAAQPADAKHPSGHGKAEYFASTVEGLLILMAALGIMLTGVNRLLHPQPLQQLGPGLAVSLLATLVNLVVGRVLVNAGRRHDSITLEADGQHLLSDVWTSLAVLTGLILVWLTGWLFWDGAVALAVALNILFTGVRLVRRSVDGLMDAGLPEEEQARILEVMDTYLHHQIQFHALRTRQAASRRFVSVHMVAPGHWSLHKAHCLAEQFERDVAAALGGATITTHLEALEDEDSFQHPADTSTSG